MNVFGPARARHWADLIGEFLGDHKLILASNRGPISLSVSADGTVRHKRGAGGLVTSVDAMLAAAGEAVWVAAATNDAERLAASQGKLITPEERRYQVALVDVPKAAYDEYYDTVSNQVLWFLHHYLFDPAYTPAYESDFRGAWSGGYERTNALIAESVLANCRNSERPFIMIQDYHLYLVPGYVRERRPDALLSFFHHVPWCAPDYFRLLPDTYRGAILRSLLSCDVVGMHTWRYVNNFMECCAQFLNAKIDRRRHTITVGDHRTTVRAYPISLSVGDLTAEAQSQTVAREAGKIAASNNGCKLLVRVDRAELSKNILRGFQAYELFLHNHPDWHGKVRFLALTYPTRENVPSYKKYSEAIRHKVREINARYGTPDWQPVELKTEDNFPRSLAAMTMFDVLLTNPVFDGMNLVAKEAAVVNRKSGVIILSETAGAAEELRDGVLSVSPFDISGTAEKIEQALTMSAPEKDNRSLRLRQIVTRNSCLKWLAHQLRDLHDVELRRGH